MEKFFEILKQFFKVYLIIGACLIFLFLVGSRENSPIFFTGIIIFQLPYILFQFLEPVVDLFIISASSYHNHTFSMLFFTVFFYDLIWFLVIKQIIRLIKYLLAKRKV